MCYLWCLQEVGNFEGSLSQDSMVCAACYIFCQRALIQHDDLRPAKSILHALRMKVDEKLTQCKSMTDSTLRSDFALLSTAVYLGDLMLCYIPQLVPKVLLICRCFSTATVPDPCVHGKRVWQSHVLGVS